MSDWAGFSLNVEEAVNRQYSEGAKAPRPDLCCPVTYDPKLLAAIPEEVLEKDYGCGDPTPYLKAGGTVLDLGSGAGKVCFLASQVVGPSGRIIGIDMNPEMLAVARRNVPEVARRIGYSNVEFRRSKIQELTLDLEKLEGWLQQHPIRTADDLALFEQTAEKMKKAEPLIPDESVDVVISSCVLNLIRPQDKQELFQEIFRVVRRGGRAVISDIVSDEDVPSHLQADPELWSGCVSGAFREDLFLKAFEQAGFYGITMRARQEQPWRTVRIEFRSMTVEAYKGKEGPCWDQRHSVVYRGPFRQVEDDDGHVLRRGARTAVCEKTYHLYSQEPYRSHLELIPPRSPVPLEEALPFPCSSGALRRHPKETKGQGYSITTEAQSVCDPQGGSQNGSIGRCC